MRNSRLPALCLALPCCLSACALPRPPEQVTAPTPAQWTRPCPPPPPARRLAAAAGRLVAPARRPAAGRTDRRGAGRQPDASPAPPRASPRRAPRASPPARRWCPTSTATRRPAAATRPVGRRAATAAGARRSPPITTLQAGLQSSWEIDLFGGLRAEPRRRPGAARRRAGRLARRARLGRGRDRQHLPRAARLRAPAGGGDVRRPLARRDRAPDRADARDAGFTAPADAALARASAAEASAAPDAAARAVRRCCVKALVALTGIDEPRRCARKLDAAPVDAAAAGRAAPSPACRPQALAQRPDVFAAERDVAAASADVGAAQAQRFPRLTLQGSIGAAAASHRRLPPDAATPGRIGPLALDAADLRRRHAARPTSMPRGALRRGRRALPRAACARRCARSRRRWSTCRAPTRAPTTPTSRSTNYQRLLRRHRGALPQRPGQPVRAGGRAAHRCSRRRPRCVGLQRERADGLDRAVPRAGRRLDAARIRHRQRRPPLTRRRT